MRSRSSRRSIPDFIRRGIRQGIGIAALVACGYEVVEPFGESSKTAVQWLTCFKWAAITLIVLTAPVLGKVTQVSFERTVGTLAGGLLGLITVLLGREMMQVTDQAFTAVISGLVGFGAVVAGHKLGLDYAGRLLAMTFILVVIGADGRADAFLVALTRCSGIILGVLVSVVLASFIFPKSASHQAADNLAAALESLLNLCHIAWNATQWNGSPDGIGSQDCYVPLDGTALFASSGADAAAAREAECEKVLMEVYNRLSKVDEFLPLAKRERYMFTFRGRWCFLPAMPCLPFGNWTIPAKPMQEMAMGMRKVSRVLWALHVTFQEGFTAEIIDVLQRRYPADTLATLQSASYGALYDIQNAFPDDTILPSANLKKFTLAVKELIAVSNRHRCFVLGMLNLPSNTASQAPKGAQMNGTNGFSDTQDAQMWNDLDFSHPDDSDTVPNTALQEKQSGKVSSSADGWQTGDQQPPFGGPKTSGLTSQETLEVFPLSDEGYITKIRWSSFQFMMQELSDDLEALHRSMATVLKMLPNALAARHI